MIVLIRHHRLRSNFTEEYLGDKNQISETFDISGVYCEPKGGAKSDDSISLLVHGSEYNSLSLAVACFRLTSLRSWLRLFR